MKGCEIMIFSKKLFKLRKEKNLSQEELAEKLGTTRQAISKWENDQGFPETEKLLMLGNIFEVSIDYLLKDTNEESNENERGYYVSREMAEGYIANQKQISRNIGMGLSVLILSLIAFLKFDNEEMAPIVLMAMLVLGLFLLLKGRAVEDKRYRILTKEPLFFDSTYLSELKAKYAIIARKCTLINIASLILITISLMVLTVDVEPFIKDFDEGVPPYIVCVILVLALVAYIFRQTLTKVRVYWILGKNDDYTKGLLFRVSRKIRRKLDEI